MIALVSPAKTLDYASPFASPAPRRARFAGEASTLATAAAKLSGKRLQALMHISPKLAKLNVDRFRGFADAPERPAIRAFAGDVYTGFEAKSLDAPAIDFADDHLRILSGLYGLLRPADAIRPHRLEMGTRWAPGRAKDLYAWWGRRVSDALAADLAEEGSGTILNLASQEYWHVVAQSPPGGARIVAIDFREPGPDGLRFNSFAAKRARGMMARWMCEHRVTDAEGMKGFDSDGYRFDRDGSDEGDVALRPPSGGEPAMILVIDNYDSFTWNLVHYFQELGAEVEVVRNDAIGAGQALSSGAEALLISPGPKTPDDAGVSLELVAAAAAAGRPLLGVCLGHQAIGQHFGGRVVRAKALMHGKTSQVTHDGTGLFADLPSPFTATRYHSLVVEDLPDSLIVNAWSEDGTVMGVRHRTMPIHGLQFHPESIATEHGHKMLANFMTLAGMTPRARDDAAHRTMPRA